MRTVSLGILAITIALSIIVPNSLKAAPEVRQNYTDLDNNGVCDYYDNNCGYTHNNGICDGYCTTNPDCGRYFTDADDDGICDNYTSHHANGNRHGSGHRGGHCR